MTTTSESRDEGRTRARRDVCRRGRSIRPREPFISDSASARAARGAETLGPCEKTAGVVAPGGHKGRARRCAGTHESPAPRFTPRFMSFAGKRSSGRRSARPPRRGSSRGCLAGRGVDPHRHQRRARGDGVEPRTGARVEQRREWDPDELMGGHQGAHRVRRRIPERVAERVGRAPHGSARERSPRVARRRPRAEPPDASGGGDARRARAPSRSSRSDPPRPSAPPRSRRTSGGGSSPTEPCTRRSASPSSASSASASNRRNRRRRGTTPEGERANAGRDGTGTKPDGGARSTASSTPRAAPWASARRSRTRRYASVAPRRRPAARRGAYAIHPETAPRRSVRTTLGSPPARTEGEPRRDVGIPRGTTRGRSGTWRRLARRVGGSRPRRR